MHSAPTRDRFSQRRNCLTSVATKMCGPLTFRTSRMIRCRQNDSREAMQDKDATVHDDETNALLWARLLVARLLAEITLALRPAVATILWIASSDLLVYNDGAGWFRSSLGEL